MLRLPQHLVELDLQLVDLRLHLLERGAGRSNREHAVRVADEALRLEVFSQVVAGHLNVRQTERIVREATRAVEPAPVPIAPASDAATHARAALEQSVQRALGTKVSLKRNAKGAGSLTIHFYSDEEFEGVLDRLGIGEI